MDQHRLLAVENKFAAGTNATGGRFSISFPVLGFTPHGYYIRQVSYDGSDNIQGPLLLSCDQLGGPIAVFNSATSQAGPTNGGAPQVCNPASHITNNSGTQLDGQLVEFTVSQNKVGSTLLSGSLTILIEAYRYKPSKEDRKGL